MSGTALNHADLSTCELVGAVGRLHFRRQGWDFQVHAEDADHVVLTWDRIVGYHSDDDQHDRSGYDYAASMPVIREIAGNNAFASTATVRYWLDGLLLDATMQVRDTWGSRDSDTLRVA